MKEELENKIRELEEELDSIKQQKTTDEKGVVARLDELEKLLKNHGHTLDDGTARLQKSVDLLPGEGYGVGNIATFSGTAEKATGIDRTVAAMITGRDSNPADGSSNSQVYLEHQFHTDGGTNQTFFQGIRAPLFVGTTGRVTSGGTTFNQTTYTWEDDELAGAFIVVNTSDASSFECYVVSSNTSNTVTISGGTWGFSGTGLNFTIYVPVYLGSANFPWRRIYTMDGTAGGIRIGPGPTAGGQNGLIYTDSSGDLYYRDYAGAAVQLNSSAASVTLYSGRVTSAGSASTPFPAGWSVSNTGTGDYTVTHNLGTSDYIIQMTADSAEHFVTVGTRSSNSFTVSTEDDAGAADNSGFYFTVHVP